ncbi:uncharacterized protein B0T23DRAFT_448982 [Neurospora hispaniola]|uniref:Uncharacterized protein n=1 Tax=Neurospora hispaniola TaxID=588809 RepID=A0AAJ0MMI3_9PEZI|nr:hypothetical protein B0T23DRAFT_448982 [Neurospora hispaniola]
MDFSEVVRLLEDTKRQEARRNVERLLNNPPSCQPPWGKNLKELVKWATECKVQSEQEPESKAPERPTLKMFQPPHLQDFWSRNPKWVTDYFVNAQKYPRLEVIVRAMVQEHLVAEQNYMSTIKAHVNPESNNEKKTGEGAREGADDHADDKAEEEAENKATEKQETGDEVSDADKKILFQDLQNVVKQHIRLKEILDCYWVMSHEGALIQDANHMLFMERRRASTAPSERTNPAPPSNLPLVFPQIHHGATPTPSSSSSSSPLFKTQAEEDAEGEKWINDRALDLREIYPSLSEEAAKELAKCEKKVCEHADFLNEYEEKMGDRTFLLMAKQMELMEIDERNKLEKLRLKAQEMALELQEKEMSEREKALRERENLKILGV